MRTPGEVGHSVRRDKQYGLSRWCRPIRKSVLTEFAVGSCHTARSRPSFMMTEPVAARARNGASEPELPQRKIRSCREGIVRLACRVGGRACGAVLGCRLGTCRSRRVEQPGAE